MRAGKTRRFLVFVHAPRGFWFLAFIHELESLPGAREPKYAPRRTILSVVACLYEIIMKLYFIIIFFY